MGKLASFVLVVTLVACGSSNNTKKPDAFQIDDAPIDARNCGAARTPEAVTFLSKNPAGMNVLWTSKITGGQDAMDLFLAYEFYNTGSSLAGTYDLSTGDQTNYMNCEVCMHASELDAQGNIVKDFFQTAGMVTLAVDPTTDLLFMGSVTGLQLEEVTVDRQGGTFKSTPVAGGACMGIADQSAINQIAAPPGWSCTADKFEDGTTCDCACGAQDTDCDVDANSVTGCSTPGDRCFQGACVTPPTNDTCQLPTPIVVGTPLNGTTKGANRSYDNGLEGTVAMPCTGFSQPGPDVVYSVVLTAGLSYTVTLSALDPMYDGSISLLGPKGTGATSICDANPITTCVKGADAGMLGATETFQYTVPVGATDTYYIIVDSGYDSGINSEGNFTLSITSP
jgi:hypothetical protein